MGLMYRQLGWLYEALNIGKRDLYKVFGYQKAPNFSHMYQKYLRQDIAGRIVDAPAAALWTEPPQVQSSSEVWNTAWKNITERHNLWTIIEKADRLAGIGRFSIILIGFNDGESLDKPVNLRRLKDKTNPILFLQQYSEAAVEIKTVNPDNTSEDFMKPLIYSVQPSRDMPLGWAGLSQKKVDVGAFSVHYSRVLHIAENALENDVYGSPRLERVYNLLDDLLKVTGGSSEAFWLTANRGMHVDVDKELELDPDDASKLSDELDEYSDGLRRFIRTRGVKITNLGADVKDPRGAFEILISLLSGATGIPRRILTGSEAGQLASDQDRANWADRIEERRANFGNPYIIFPLIKKLTAAGVLPMEENIQVTVQWSSAFKLSPLENAQTSAQHARSATNFAKAIETMANLKRGDPGTPETTNPDGTAVPGKPAVPGLDLPDLVTVDEARKMLGLDKPVVTFDSGDDLV